MRMSRIDFNILGTEIVNMEMRKWGVTPRKAFIKFMTENRPYADWCMQVTIPNCVKHYNCDSCIKEFTNSHSKHYDSIYSLIGGDNDE
jgi:hypothetical protein